MGASVFFLDIFIIAFRESLEAAVIVSVLISFVKQSFGQPGMDRRAYRRLLWHVWLGVAVGFFICLCIGAGIIGAFYVASQDVWSTGGDLWEGIFALIASIMITVMGLGMLRVEKMKEKWRVKISEVILEGGLDDPKYKGKMGWFRRMNPKNFNPLKLRMSSLGRWTRKYAMFLLTSITVLREGVEAVVFIAGVSMGHPAYSYPLSVFLGLLCGCGIGYLLYLGGSRVSMRWFLIGSTCFLYLISAGLFSRAIWYLQMYVFSEQTGGDVAESGSGPGSYNVKQIVWHVNCCNPELNNNGWGIFNALLGWQNSATYGSVISYNCYWIFIDVLIIFMIYEERHGEFPLIGKYIKRRKVTSEEANEMFRRAQEMITTDVNHNGEEGELETGEPKGGIISTVTHDTASMSSDEKKNKNSATVHQVPTSSSGSV